MDKSNIDTQTENSGIFSIEDKLKLERKIKNRTVKYGSIYNKPNKIKKHKILLLLIIINGTKIFSVTLDDS